MKKRTSIYRAIFISLVSGFGQKSFDKADLDLLEKKIIRLPNAKLSNAPHRPGLLIGKTLYLSGSIGNDPSTGQIVKAGFEPELWQAIANAKYLMNQAGMNPSNVVSVQALGRYGITSASTKSIVSISIHSRCRRARQL